jgi:hypothetical protein
MSTQNELNEPQIKALNLTPSVKSKRTLLKAQFFQGKTDSEMEEELIHCYYEHHSIPIDSVYKEAAS